MPAQAASTAPTHAPIAAAGSGAPPLNSSLLARFGAEFVGTFLIVFVGFGALLYDGVFVQANEATRLLAWGGAIAIAVALFARVSGGHFNPALTLGAAIARRIRWSALPAYWVAQILGALAAAGLLFLTIPTSLPALAKFSSRRDFFADLASGYGDHSLLGVTTSGQATTSLTQVLLIEAIGTALFVAAALLVAQRREISRLGAALVTGGAYGILTVPTHFITGGALNPARASAGAVFGPDWALGQVWLFWAAPLLGGLFAGLLVSVFASLEEIPDIDFAENLGEEEGLGAEDVGADQLSETTLADEANDHVQVVAESRDGLDGEGVAPESPESEEVAEGVAAEADEDAAEEAEEVAEPLRDDAFEKDYDPRTDD